MKRIMISIKSEHFVKESSVSRDKWLECRKNKALRKAIEREIKENGKAKVLVYCSKGKPHYNLKRLKNDKWENCGAMNGKVCGYIIVDKIYDVFLDQSNYCGSEDFYYLNVKWERDASVPDYMQPESPKEQLEDGSCLTQDQLYKYYGGKSGYALYISGVELFDKPKELCEFYTTHLDKTIPELFDNSIQLPNGVWVKPLTKAPQNFMYVESEV